ncbi:MAG: CbiX/SirB N-terminal domain-containing protein [Bryobacteraceae bacterium]|nr:CbiX/SirB N-terminal domain-containing protein [Bryobacteraceae bacterium]MDW8378580.1 CbiX/SirB N-terminal domain-containing protein [Bryobacterales bacterium]
MQTAIIVFAHGSSVESANQAVRAVTTEVARMGGFSLVETAFLELARPDLAEAVDSVARAGAKRVVVVPFFLTLGIHLQRDLPRMVLECQQKYPTLKIDVTDPLEGHPALRQIVLERAQKALNPC